MNDYGLLDENALCDELLKHYLEPEYYMATKRPLVCVTTKKEATTLDEYIKLLSEGYINVEILEKLDKYADELLENEWFHKWPLVQWVHMHRAFDRKTAVDYKKRRSQESVAAEIRTLDFLAKNGWPGAMADIGRCGFIGKIPGKSFEQCICMWIYAYRTGYMTAGAYLFAQLKTKEYMQLCEEIKMFVLEGAIGWFLDNNDATESNYKEILSGWPLERTRELLNHRKCMRKIVADRALIRGTAGRLFGPEGESLYEINYE